MSDSAVTPTPDLSPEDAIVSAMPCPQWPDLNKTLAADVVRALGKAGYVIIKRGEVSDWMEPAGWLHNGGTFCSPAGSMRPPAEFWTLLYRVKPDA